jgi:uncharacterized LabA/DUF88 family protein
MARANGFEVITYQRDSKNKEKAVHTKLVARRTLTIATTAVPTALVIGSGDRDFIPLVRVELGSGNVRFLQHLRAA